MSEGGEASGWVQHEDQVYGTYYYNPVSGETSWTLPEGARILDVSSTVVDTGAGTVQHAGEGSPGDLLDVDQWQRHEDPEYGVFYVNKVTGESSWTPPTMPSGNGYSSPDRTRALSPGTNFGSPGLASLSVSTGASPTAGRGVGFSTGGHTGETGEGMDDGVWPATDTLYRSVNQNYARFRQYRLEGKDVTEDMEPEVDVVIPTVDMTVPLDPFLLKPWVRVEHEQWGAYYYNVETGESTWEEPEPVWQRKLQDLSKLTPREVSIKERKRRTGSVRVGHPDFNMWKLREDEETKKERLLLESVAQINREKAVARRRDFPTSGEAVHDCMDQLIEGVEARVHKLEAIARHKTRVHERRTWHVSCQRHLMNTLPQGGQTEMVDGMWQSRRLVTDLELTPVTVTQAGFVVPTDVAKVQAKAKNKQTKQESTGPTGISGAVMVTLYLACKLPPMTRRPPPPKQAQRASAPQDMAATSGGHEQAPVSPPEAPIQATEAASEPAGESIQPLPIESGGEGAVEPQEGSADVATGQQPVPAPQVQAEPEPELQPLEAPRDRFLQLLMNDLTSALGIPATIVSIEEAAPVVSPQEHPPPSKPTFNTLRTLRSMGSSFRRTPSVAITGRRDSRGSVSVTPDPFMIGEPKDGDLSATSRGALLPNALLPRRRSRSIAFAESTISVPPPPSTSNQALIESIVPEEPGEAGEGEAGTGQKSAAVATGEAGGVMAPKNLGQRAEVAWQVVRSVGGKAAVQAAKELREGAVEVAKLVAAAIDEHNEDAGCDEEEAARRRAERRRLFKEKRSKPPPWAGARKAVDDMVRRAANRGAEVPLIKNRLLPMYRSYLEAQRQRLMYKPLIAEPSVDELRDVTIVFPGNNSLTMGIHEMTRRLGNKGFATIKPSGSKYPLSKNGVLKMLKDLASPGKRQEDPASPQEPEEATVGKLDTQHPCMIKILLLPERKVSAARRRAHDEAMSYVLANDLSRTKRRKKPNVLDRVKPWLVPQRRPKDAIKLAKALEACKPRTGAELAEELTRLAKQAPGSLISNRLRQGLISHTIYRVKWEEVGEARSFVRWEDFWCNVMSPVFFGYSANNRLGAKSKQALHQPSQLSQLSEPSQHKAGKAVGTASMSAFSRSIAGTVILPSKEQPETLQAVIGHKLSPEDRLEAAEKALERAMRTGLHYGHMTKQQYVASEAYARALRLYEQAERKQQRQAGTLGGDSLDAWHSDILHSPGGRKGKNAVKLEDPLVTQGQMAIWENEVFREKVAKRRALTTVSKGREGERRAKVRAVLTYNRLRTWMYHVLKASYPELSILKIKLQRVEHELQLIDESGHKVESTGLDDYMVKLKELQEAKRTRQEALDRASRTVFKALLGMPEPSRPTILQPERQNSLRGMLSTQRSSSRRLSDAEGEGSGSAATAAGMDASIGARLRGQDAPRMSKAEEERRDRQQRRSQGRLPKAEVIRLLSEASTDQVPEVLMREAAIQALLSKANYTKSFVDFKVIVDGYVDELEFLTWIKVADLMLKHFASIDAEIEDIRRIEKIKKRIARRRKNGQKLLAEDLEALRHKWDFDRAYDRMPQTRERLQRRLAQGVAQKAPVTSKTTGAPATGMSLQNRSPTSGAASPVSSPKAAIAGSPRGKFLKGPALSRGLSRKEKRRLIKDELRKKEQVRVKRERLFAHHHTYIPPSCVGREGKEAYCCLCRARIVDKMWMDLQEGEAVCRSHWEEELDKRMVPIKVETQEDVDMSFGPGEQFIEVMEAIDEIVDTSELLCDIRTDVAEALFTAVDVAVYRQAARQLGTTLENNGFDLYAVLSIPSADPQEQPFEQPVFVATAGENVEERVQQISRSRNKIGSGPALTQRMEDWSRTFIQREKRRRIHEAEEALEQQEASRRQMFKEEMDMRIYEERALKHQERPFILHQETTHRLYSSLLERMPLVHPDLKRLRWERTLSDATDNFTFLVVDPPVNMRYILRVLNCSDPKHAEYAVKESKRLKQLSSHTGLVAVRDVYQHRLFSFSIDGHPTAFHHVVLILLDYCDDGRLAEYTKTAMVDEVLMTRYASHLVTGLKSLHEAGLLHRNLQLKAMYMQGGRHARLGDYKYLLMPEDPEEGNVDDFSQTSICAPELALGGKPTAKSEVWTFGYCLFCILSGGRHPNLRALQCIPNELPVKYSDRLAGLVCLCLEPDPEKRPTATQLDEFMRSRSKAKGKEGNGKA